MPNPKPRRARIAWKSHPDDPDEESVWQVEPPTGANMVTADDPAYSYILTAARQLMSLGFDPHEPDIAQRAIDVGHRDYENNHQIRAERSLIRRAEQKHGQVPVATVVYYMRVGNRVKIGWSSNLAARLANFNPEELMATEPGGRKLEHVRHRQFADLRAQGEWFRLEPPLTEHIASLKVGSVARPRLT